MAKLLKRLFTNYDNINDVRLDIDDLLNDLEYDGMHICQSNDALTHLRQGRAAVLAPEMY